VAWPAGPFLLFFFADNRREAPGLDSLLFSFGLLKDSTVTSNRKNSTVHILCVVITPSKKEQKLLRLALSTSVPETHTHPRTHAHTPLNPKPVLPKVNDVWAKVICDPRSSADLSHFHQEMCRQPAVRKNPASAMLAAASSAIHTLILVFPGLLAPTAKYVECFVCV
jgi:hypothetical protein